MTQIDQFESVFKSAIKDVFTYTPIVLSHILVVTDLPETEINPFVEKIKQFVPHSEAEWIVIGQSECETTEDLLNFAESKPFDLICTYRNLHTKAWQFPYSLGDKLDVLLQKITTPVLVLPHPKAGYADDGAMSSTKTVMAVTDHLSNDHCLVNYATHFTESSGQLFLTHIEDQLIYDRYMDVISKIPSVDTEDTGEKLRRQLLKMPIDYIASCSQVLQQERADIQIHDIVHFGHHLSEYKKYIEQEQVDLLVMHAKEDEQLAMHGLAYPLVIELRHIPLLML
jgi:hypothetical protein